MKKKTMNLFGTLDLGQSGAYADVRFPSRSAPADTHTDCSPELLQFCSNGGTCFFYPERNNFKCICPPGLTGARCDQIVPTVALRPTTLLTTSSTDLTSIYCEKAWARFQRNVYLIGVLSGAVIITLLCCFVCFVRHRNSIKRFGSRLIVDPDDALVHKYNPTDESCVIKQVHYPRTAYNRLSQGSDWSVVCAEKTFLKEPHIQEVTYSPDCPRCIDERLRAFRQTGRRSADCMQVSQICSTVEDGYPIIPFQPSMLLPNNSIPKSPTFPPIIRSQQAPTQLNFDYGPQAMSPQRSPVVQINPEPSSIHTYSSHRYGDVENFDDEEEENSTRSSLNLSYDDQGVRLLADFGSTDTLIGSIEPASDVTLHPPTSILSKKPNGKRDCSPLICPLSTQGHPANSSEAIRPLEQQSKRFKFLDFKNNYSNNKNTRKEYFIKV